MINSISITASDSQYTSGASCMLSVGGSDVPLRSAGFVMSEENLAELYHLIETFVYERRYSLYGHWEK